MADAIFPHAEYDRIIETTIDEIRKLGTLKGGEYAGDVDRLANFRRNAQALVPRGRLDHGVAIGQAGCQRLLHQHVDSGFGRAHGRRLAARVLALARAPPPPKP